VTKNGDHVVHCLADKAKLWEAKTMFAPIHGMWHELQLFDYIKLGLFRVMMWIVGHHFETPQCSMMHFPSWGRTQGGDLIMSFQHF